VRWRVSIKSVLAGWIPPALSSKKRDEELASRVASKIIQRSLIPQETWKFWGFRRDAMTLAKDAFEKVGWVYDAVRTIGRNVQQVPFYAVRSISGRAAGTSGA
jgi:hypothetical protein